MATRSELYSTASTLCVLILLTFMASCKTEQWFRVFMTFTVLGMQFLYLVLALRSKPRRERGEPRSNGLRGA